MTAELACRANLRRYMGENWLMPRGQGKSNVVPPDRSLLWGRLRCCRPLIAVEGDPGNMRRLEECVDAALGGRSLVESLNTLGEPVELVELLDFFQ
jgi:hypothetical protein